VSSTAGRRSSSPSSLDYTTNHAWLVFVVVTTAATLWRLFFGKGPLERLLTWSCIRATGATSAIGTTRTAGGIHAS
jgi:hypothetical protein